MVEMLESALAGGDVASLMIGHEDLGELENAAKLLTPIAQEKDVAVLIEGSVEIALKVGADGVVVDGSVDDYHKARAALGDDIIIGVDCGVDRHVAMAMGEAGADFVIFDDEAVGSHQGEILQDTETQLSQDQLNEPVANWWARVFEVPCVVMAPQSSANATDRVIGRVKASIKSGVEFICPSTKMWENAASAEQTVAEYNQLIKDTPVDEF